MGRLQLSVLHAVSPANLRFCLAEQTFFWLALRNTSGCSHMSNFQVSFKSLELTGAASVYLEASSPMVLQEDKPVRQVPLCASPDSQQQQLDIKWNESSGFSVTQILFFLGAVRDESIHIYFIIFLGCALCAEAPFSCSPLTPVLKLFSRRRERMSVPQMCLWNKEKAKWQVSTAQPWCRLLQELWRSRRSKYWICGSIDEQFRLMSNLQLNLPLFKNIQYIQKVDRFVGQEIFYFVIAPDCKWKLWLTECLNNTHDNKNVTTKGCFC